jgi:hypothetical protein
MKQLKPIIMIFAILVFSMSAFAMPEDLENPGMTPDSPFYFLDTMFDGLQSAESLANEKGAEVVAMAQENKLNALEKARERYENAMQKRIEEADESEENAEEVTRQASRHMEVLAEVYEKVPEQARQGIENAMHNSAEGREKALNRLTERNRERANEVAQETLTEILENAPEQAKPGLQRALETAGSEIPPAQSGEAGGSPSGDSGNKPEDTGSEEDELSQGNKTENTGSNDEGKGGFRLLVSDAPADIADFEYLIVELSKTRIFMIGGDGFEEKDLDASVDLTEVVGEASMEVLSTELEPGKYNKIELYVDSVDAKANGETANVMVPSGKLQIIKTFEIVEGQVTTFVFDINVVRKGQNNEYNLLPVISKSGVVGQDIDEDDVEEIEECESDEDCEEGYKCIDGECEEIEEEEEEECESDEDCDDGLWCNGAETCVDNTCQTGTAVDCDDEVSYTVDSCNEETDSCDNTPDNSLCDDGLWCNGEEYCDATLGCQAGTPPDCDDGGVCTIDSCNETTDSCDHIPDDSLCEEGYECVDGACQEMQ